MLLIFGLGASARRFVELHGAEFGPVTATVRDGERAAAISKGGVAGVPVQALVFDGEAASPQVKAAVAAARHILISVPPGAAGDPVFRLLAREIAASENLQGIVYLSTIGVYGDHDGNWVDETAELRGSSTRNKWRVAAEADWTALAAARGTPLAILRLSGIYGPGHNVLLNLKTGKARRVIRPGQVFNRIHVDDIAQGCALSFRRGANGAFNITDDEPSPPGEVLEFAAGLMGLPVPPEISWEEASVGMSPMALSFWGEVKRASNAKARSELGFVPKYPTYREGLTALWQAGEGA